MLGEDDCMGEIEETRIRELVGMEYGGGNDQ
jgi:hypothetical protein